MDSSPCDGRTTPNFPRTAARERGLTAAETVVVLALTAALLLVGIPYLDEARRGAALRSVAQQVNGLMVRSRTHAIMRQQTTAVVFEPSPSWRCYVAADGDGDGVRRDDLSAGRDRIVGEVVRLRCRPGGLGILTDERIPNPSGTGWLRGNMNDPVRAGRGDIISFTPTGTATPGSVYMTDHRSQMRVLRIYGATGRVRCMVWKVGWPQWKQTWW
jgi:Tfp pilus assembly protein FimT